MGADRDCSQRAHSRAPAVLFLSEASDLPTRPAKSPQVRNGSTLQVSSFRNSHPETLGYILSTPTSHP